MGIVHHSNYPIWFEAARTDLKIEERGFMLPHFTTRFLNVVTIR